MATLKKILSLLVLITISFLVVGANATTPTGKVFPLGGEPGRKIRVSGVGFDKGCEIIVSALTVSGSEFPFDNLPEPGQNPNQQSEPTNITNDKGEIWGLFEISSNAPPGDCILKVYNSVNHNQGFTIPSFKITGPVKTVVRKIEIPINSQVDFGQIGLNLASGFNVIQSSEDSFFGNTIEEALVKGKPIMLLVNAPEANNNLAVTFDGETVDKSVWSQGIQFFGPYKPETNGIKDIKLTDNGTPVTTIKVNVKTTQIIKIGSYSLVRANAYGEMTPNEYSEMKTNSNGFVKATFPTNDTKETDWSPQPGAKRGNPQDMFAGVRTDACNVAKAALGVPGLGSAFGVAFGPNNPTVYGTDYFTWHGFPQVAGISFGPAFKGVVVLDGYWSGEAHEAGHIYGLYWYTAEEYQMVPPGPPGYQVAGLNPIEGVGTLRSGIDFMGYSEYKYLGNSWVRNSTYIDLLNKLKTSQTDPEILIVNGLVYRNDTFAAIDPIWYKLEGVPSWVPDGNYSLRFIGEIENKTYTEERRFDLKFQINIQNTVDANSTTPGFGTVDTDVAAFCFATEYYFGEYTKKIQLLHYVPERDQPVVLKEFNASDIQPYPYPQVTIEGPYSEIEDKPVNFDASVVGGGSLTYRWDFDDDGKNDTSWSPSPQASHTWDTEWSGNARLEVKYGSTIQSSVTQVTITHQETLVETLERVWNNFKLYFLGIIMATIFCVVVYIWKKKH